MAERKCPVLLRKGAFSGAIYAARRYTIDKGGLMTMHDKDDVTQDFYRIAAELWPQLVDDGSLKPIGPVPSGGA